jgi:hypothetical protein
MTTFAESPRLVDDGAELPAEVALNVYRGDNRSWVFRLWVDEEKTIPYSLVQVTEVTAQVRRTPDDRTAVALRTQVVQPNYIFVHLDAAQAAICPSGRWDLQLTFPGSRILTVIRGPVIVTADVTR